jgi:hypothetical protein
MMPHGYAELLQLINTFGLWFTIVTVLIGIIINYLILPAYKKHKQSKQEALCMINRQHQAILHPTEIDHKKNPVIITRHQIVTLLQELKTRCGPSVCPILPIMREDTGLLRQEIREHSVVVAQGKEAILREIENFAKKVGSDQITTEKDFKEFADKILERYAMTHEETVKMFDRFNFFVDGLGSRMIEMIEKIPELIQKATEAAGTKRAP